MKATLERLLLYAAAAAFIVIGVLELLGQLDSEWLKQRIPAILLLTTGLLIGLIVHLLEDRMTKIHQTLDDLKAFQAKDTLEKVAALSKEIDDRLAPVIGDYVADLLKSVVSIFQDQEFKLPNVEEFRVFYKRTLEVYAGAEFRSTSLPSEQFFWPKDKESPIYRAIADFIQNKHGKGGKMTRIFFIRDDSDIYDGEISGILRRQHQLGVTVYTTVRKGLPEELQGLFMVDREGRIGWELTSRDNIVGSVLTTSNPNRTSEYNKRIDRILKLDGTRRYQVISVDPNQATSAPLEAAEVQRFKEYERESWETAAEAYDQYFSRLTGQTIADLLENAEASSQTSILDVATGPGDIVSAARSRGANAVGIDISDAMIHKARQKHPNETFLVGDVEQLPFPDQRFDAVIMNFGIMHFGDPERALREVARVLRKGGRLTLTAWSRSEEGDVFSLVLNAIERFGVPASVPRGPDFFQFGGLEHCSRVFGRIGLEDIASKWLALNWHLRSADEMLSAFLRGSARIGGLLRRQSETTMEQIREALRKDVRPTRGSAEVVIPMSALMVCARKR